MQAPAGAVWNGKDVDATTIERQLSSLWKEVTEDTAYPGAVRTSILNLVVYTRDEQEADRVSDALINCSERHPSRTIILVSDRRKVGSSVDAAVSVRCASSPSNRPLCYEEVRITGHGRVADHLSSLVIPLQIPQLPTYLWWPGQPPFGHRMFHDLLSVANQLVIDSAQFNAPGDGLTNLAMLCRHGKQGVNDFNWGRLTPWREVIAQFFDGPTWVPYLYGIRSVNLEFGTGGDHQRATAGTLLLLGWIGSHLGWQPETTLDGLLTHDITVSLLQGDRLIDVGIHFENHGELMAGRLTGIELVSQPKGLSPARFSVQRMQDRRNAQITAKAHEGVEINRVIPLAVKEDVDLLTDELELAGQDRMYEAAADAAARIAGRVLWVPA